MFYRKNSFRKIKKIFQWQEYLSWRNMSPTQKLNFKRACLFPFFAYIVYLFLSKYTFSIIIILGIYYLIRFKNRNKLDK